MTDLYMTALDVQHLCEQQGWPFCIIGGIAVHRWGEIRVTQDVDLTLFTGFGGEEHFIDFWVKHYRLRPSCSPQSALANRVLLLANSRGVPIDIAFGAIDFERRSIERSSLWQLPEGGALRTCSAEDLLVHKCFASRNQDWADVDRILARQVGKLDLELVRKELKPLVDLKEDPQIINRLEERILHYSQPFTRIKPSKRRPDQP
jgi:hypothetical protein